MGNLEGFNAAEVEPLMPRAPVPAGEYIAIITDSSEEVTKDGKGKYVKLKLQIIDGEYEGRPLYERLNVVNRNETAVRIAKATLSAICRAVGKLTPEDSVELHNIPMRVTLAVETRKDNGQLTNRIKGYMPATASSSAPTTPKPAAVPSPSGAGKKAPWAR